MSALQKVITLVLSIILIVAIFAAINKATISPLKKTGTTIDENADKVNSSITEVIDSSISEMKN